MKTGLLLMLFAFFMAVVSVQAQVVEQENIFAAHVYQVGPKIYPRFSVSGQSIYKSGWGVYALAEYGKSIAYPEWVTKGYVLKETFNISLNAGVSYDFHDSGCGDGKIVAGVGFGTGKSYLGPFLAVALQKGNFSLDAKGVYAVLSPYRSNYSQEMVDLHGNHLVYVQGFDPNSWYRASLSYDLSKSFKIGVISERFYATGLHLDYKLIIRGESVQGLQFRTIFGRNLEIDQNCFGFGVSMSI